MDWTFVIALLALVLSIVAIALKSSDRKTPADKTGVRAETKIMIENGQDLVVRGVLLPLTKGQVFEYLVVGPDPDCDNDQWYKVTEDPTLEIIMSFPHKDRITRLTVKVKEAKKPKAK